MKAVIIPILLLVSLLSIHAQISPTDKRIIDEYVEKATVGNAVGQLFMTGLPTDIAQYEHDGVVKALVQDLGIGWFQLNTYNYYWNRKDVDDEAELLSRIRSFYNYIETLPKGANLNLPIGIAANFEGERITSITNIVTQVPEALTLAMTNSNLNAFQGGQVVGHQLREMGVHLLLGPVIDIDSIATRDYATTIQNRTFGGSPELVANATSQFLSGLKQNGVLAVGKHFPGYGGVLQDSNNETMPVSKMSVEAFESSLYPYRVLQSNLDGVMTAHIAVNIFKNNENRVVTFSPYFVTDLLRADGRIKINDKTIAGLGYGDKVAITDDLSDMGAIRWYMKDRHISWKTEFTGGQTPC